ncbi:MAG: hypothetical protein KKG00_12520 [Bacteroidetes bacterium]|nr:hypothetical protein [Bacteroidota bacterium]
MEKLTNFYLGTLDLFSGLFTRLGVDSAQLRAIVGVKLTMDQRRSRTGFNGVEKKATPWGYAWSLVITFLISTFVAAVVLLWPSPVAAYSIVAAYGMILITMTLITDFSQVILDSSDSAIILPRPVSDRTLVSSRLVHAFIYLTQLSLACLLPAILASFYKYGLVPGLVLVFVSVLIALLSVLFTMVLYLVLMQFATEEKLRNIINGLQIVMVIVVTVGYQVVLRIFNFEAMMESAFFQWAWWHALVPPMWVGYVMYALIEGVFTLPIAICLALLAGLPLLAVRVLNSGLAKKFNSSIGNIDTVTRQQPTDAVAVVRKSLSERLAPWFTRTPTERGAFELVWKITARDRKFKLRAYPTMVYFLVIIPFMFVNRSQGEGFDDMVAAAAQSDWQKIIMVYFSAIVLSTIQQNISFLDQYKASWVYHIAPMAHPGEILTGSLWAGVVKFLLPVLGLIGLVMVLVWGLESLDDLVLGALVIIVLQQVLMLATQNTLPFSREFTKNDGGQFVKVLGLLVLMGLVGFGHWALSRVPYVVLGVIPLVLWLVLFLNREIRKLSWEKVQ